MKKKVWMLLLCVSVAAATAACGSDAKGTEDATQAEADATQTYDGPRSAQIAINLEQQIKTLSEYKGIDVTISGKYEVTDEAVEQNALQLLSYYGAGTTEVTDRDTVQDGDYVMIDYVGYKDDVAFDGGTSTDVMMDVSNNRDVTNNSYYIDGFCDDLVGAKVGDVLDTHVTFPENYDSEELAGQPAVFQITVKGIYAPLTLEALTDERVAELFANEQIATKADLLEDVRKMMESQMESYRSQETANAVQSYIIEHSEVEIPEEYMAARMEELEYSTAADNCAEGQTLEQLLEANGTTLAAQREVWRKSLEQQIKSEFLFGRIAELEGLTAEDEEFSSFVSYLVQSNDGLYSAENIYSYYGLGDTEAGERELRKLFLVNRAIRFVADNANVTVEKTTEGNQ